ncbi:MAG: dimethylarginine dimethylaminohydrolase family protein [Gammaproteobacteria bacterium]
MCPPRYFEVTYRINPWMDPAQTVVDRTRAFAQWSALREALARSARIIEIAPLPGLPDMVFTANAGLVLRGQAVVSRFLHAERRGEEAPFRTFFEAHGFAVEVLPDEMFFEGAGDALFDRRSSILWAGSGWRSLPQGHEWLSRKLGCEVVSLELVDPRFYHLDTCFCPLADGALLYYPGAFSPASQASVEAHVAPRDRIAVSLEDALRFTCNAVNLGSRIALHAISLPLRQTLESRGFEVMETPLDEFLKAGGSAKCLTLRLDETLAPGFETNGADSRSPC